jgi:hypothetical protein
VREKADPKCLLPSFEREKVANWPDEGLQF